MLLLQHCESKHLIPCWVVCVMNMMEQCKYMYGCRLVFERDAG